jgi:lipopolysaccharide/colanic/teichoic acid biosynthesis glycosyltransferase
MDVLGAAALLLCLWPLLALCAVLLRLTSKGPLLYCHNRVGKNGQPFAMWKFRTMYTDAACILASHLASDPQARAEWNQNFKLRRDPRVTPIGRILRRFSLDELPQLWNVLCGDMSLVGPRPIVKDEICRFGASFGAYCAVRPGMTGRWQVSGRSSTSYEQRVRMDEEYVHSWSMTRDLIILCQTVGAVVKADGAW